MATALLRQRPGWRGVLTFAPIHTHMHLAMARPCHGTDRHGTARHGTARHHLSLIGAASLHMATIDSSGAASMGFHLAPKYLELDPYSGDFGAGLYGHVQLATSFYVNDPVHGSLFFSYFVSFFRVHP